MKTEKKNYQPGKMRPIISLAASMIKKDPTLLDDPEYSRLRAQLKLSIPELGDPEHCANCGASMAQYNFNLSVLDVLLVQAMARDVRERLRKGVPFTEANKVHLPSLTTASHNVVQRRTYTSKLGLIAKLDKEGQQVSGTWVITKAGWDGLKGNGVRRCVTVFRGKILSRDEEKVTFSAILAGYKPEPRDKVDYSSDVRSFNINEWVEVAGYNQGNLL